MRLHSKFKIRYSIFLLVVVVLQFAPMAAEAVLYTPDNLKFTVRTERTTYRSWWGGTDIVIRAELSIPSGAPAVVKGDKINRSINMTIDGFLVATIDESKKSSCGYLGCSFDAYGPTADTVGPIPVWHTIAPLNPAVVAGGRFAPSNTVTKRFGVFAAIDVTGTDVPFTNNWAPVTIEVYKDQASYDAAAAAKGVTPAQFAAEGTGSAFTSGGNAESSVLGGGADALTGTLLSVVNGILTAIIGILRWIVWLIAVYVVMPILEVTLTMDAANIASTIQFGWTFVRDIVNMIFILILIVLGFATMLRMESYNYRQILVELIIMAVLVNFSLVIARIIIQIADIVQFTFLPQGEGMSGVRYLFQVLIQDQTKVAINGLSFSTAGALASSASLIFQFILELGVVITFAALASYTLIRVIALWMLMILSPFAYALRVLPNTKHQADEWWTYFIKYAFFTPVIAFFLRLTVELHRKGLSITQGTSFSSGNASDIQTFLARSGSNDQVNLASTLELIIIYIIVLAFMWAGIIVAGKIGIYGADAITSVAKKGLGAPFAGGWGAIKGLGGLAKRAYSGYVGAQIGEHERAGQLAEATYQKAMQKADALRKAGKTRAADIVEERAATARKTQMKHARKSAGWRMAAMLDPHVLKEAWAKRKHEKEMRDYEPAIGHMVDTFNRVIPTEWAGPQRLKNLWQKGEMGKKTYHGMVAKRGVVSAEADELLKGVRTREDAARIADKAFASGDKDEIEAALKVLQHGNWQDDYMNLRGKKFSVTGYLNDITGRMSKAGFSGEEQIMILDDLKETAEAAGRLRGYGYDREDEDGVIRAANDFGYYRGLGKDDMVKKLTDVQEKFDTQYTETGNLEFKHIADAMKTGIQEISSSTDDNAARAKFSEIFEAKDAEGRNVGRNYYQANSEYKATDDVYDHSLNNVLTSRRFMDEAHIKLRRGNAGTHARNIEAAVIDDQDPNEGWTRMNLLGSMLTHEVGPNIIESITARIHESQGRLLQGFGALQDSATGKWELPDYDIVKQTNIDITAKSGGDTHKKELLEEQQTQHIRGMDKMVTTARLNRKMFNAITGSDRLFTYEQRSHFATNFNEYLDAKGIPSAGQGAIERINISDLPGEPRSARGGSGAGQGGGAAQPIITPPTGFGSGARSTTTFPGGGPGLTTPGPNAPGTPGNVPGAPPSGANPSPGGTNPGGPTIITP